MYLNRIVTSLQNSSAKAILIGCRAAPRAVIGIPAYIITALHRCDGDLAARHSVSLT